jgi:hypothetical protein
MWYWEISWKCWTASSAARSTFACDVLITRRNEDNTPEVSRLRAELQTQFDEQVLVALSLSD